MALSFHLPDGKKLRTNIYVALVLQLALVMALYSLCRIGFFLYNNEFFADMTWSRFAPILLGGLRFDLSAVLYLNALFILLTIIPLRVRFKPAYMSVLRFLFLFINSLGLAANVIDFVYYRFTLRRTTLSVFSQFENEQNLTSLFFQFLVDYWYMFFLWIALVVALWFGYRFIKVEGPQAKNPWVFYLSGLGLMLLITYGVVGGMRGGFRHSTRPITLSNAADYSKIPKDIHLVLNTPFALMRTAGTSVIEKVNYFENDQLVEQIFPVTHYPPDSASFRNDNVMIIILESYSKEFIGTYNPDLENGTYKGYAPFLDSLIGVSRAYQYSFANGRKSIDAMPSVICSIPSIEVPYVLSHYSSNKVNSLASLLKPKGYYSAFFHGAPNGSMGFQAFANLCGFDDYFGMTEYGNDDDFDNIWGIWDHKFMPWMLGKINEFKQPFFVNFFSVSSHHPYKVPAEFENQLSGGQLPVHKTIQYTDVALKTFFREAAKQPWFQNTLFVITADHASAEIQYQQYNSAWGYFSVPIFFYHPQANWSSFKHEIVQQIDIMPTVLDYLNYDKPYIAFGRNVFTDDAKPFAFNYLNNNYQAFSGDYLLMFDGAREVALYDFKADPMLINNLAGQRPDFEQPLLLRLKAFIQQYNNRMVDDHLTLEGPQKVVIQATKK